MTTSNTVPRQSTPGSPAPAKIADLTPFAVEPFFLAKLHKHKIRPAFVGIAAMAIALLTTAASASFSNLLYRPNGAQGWWKDFWSFVVRSRTGRTATSVPFLSDYPSIILTVTIAVAVYLVYALFIDVSTIHSDMESAGCLRYDANGRKVLDRAVEMMNGRFVKWGKVAWLPLLAAFGFTIFVNARLNGHLFTFSGKSLLYAHWWASLKPLRYGGIVWIGLGGFGIYMVYVEAILGLTYLSFLRKFRTNYQFRANLLNPDGLFGWTRARRVISNLEAGVVLTLVSSWAMWFYLQPALGSAATVGILAVFDGIVMYVFVGVTYNFRKQVKNDRAEQRREIGREIDTPRASTDVGDLIKVLIAYNRLDLVSKIPSVPIRPAWLLAGAFSILGPISAIAVQLLKFFKTG